MNDGQIWPKIFRDPLQNYGVFQRIENSVATGMPDVAYCVYAMDGPAPENFIHGHTGFIELKLVHGADDHRTIILQRTQIPWHRARALIAPNDYWFFAYDTLTSDIYVIRGAELMRMPNRPMGERHNQFTIVDGLVRYRAKRADISWSRVSSHLAHR